MHWQAKDGIRYFYLLDPEVKNVLGRHCTYVKRNNTPFLGHSPSFFHGSNSSESYFCGRYTQKRVLGIIKVPKMPLNLTFDTYEKVSKIVYLDYL